MSEAVYAMFRQLSHGRDYTLLWVAGRGPAQVAQELVAFAPRTQPSGDAWRAINREVGESFEPQEYVMLRCSKARRVRL